MPTGIFEKMVVLFSIMALGYIAGKTRVMTLDGNKTLSKLVNCITNPCAVLYSALCTEHSLSNGQIFQLLGIAVAMFTCLIAVAQLVPKLLGVAREKAGLYKFMMIFSNIGYMGIPVISAIFGASATISVTVFILVFYFFIYSYGIFLLHEGKGKFSPRAFLSPMMVSCVIAIVCYLLGVQVTGIGKEILNSVRGVTTPCAMLIIGCALSTLPVKALFSNWRLYIVAALKLLILPAAAYLCLHPVMGDSQIFKMLIVIMAMPIASNFTMLCAQYDKDQQLPATAVFITTALSVITIPLIAALLR